MFWWEPSWNRFRSSLFVGAGAELVDLAHERLLEGEVTYGRKGFDKNPSQLVEEIDEELADAIAYLFMLWMKTEDGDRGSVYVAVEGALEAYKALWFVENRKERERRKVCTCGYCKCKKRK